MRLLAGVRLLIAVGASVGLPAQLAHAAPVPGALSQLPTPNECIQQTGATLCSSHAVGINGTVGLAITPDGKNAYVVATSSQAVAELARSASGALSQLASPNDCVSSQPSSLCGTTTAKGLLAPEAIAVSPDGKNVYVAAEDRNGIGTIAEFARNPDGTLTQLSSTNACIAENSGQYPGGTPAADCTNNQGAHGIHIPIALSVSPDGNNVYVVDQDQSAIAVFTRTASGALTQPGGADDCIAEHDTGFGDCNRSGNGLHLGTRVRRQPRRQQRLPRHQSFLRREWRHRRIHARRRWFADATSEPEWVHRHR